VSAHQLIGWKKVEHALLHREIKIPLYFARADDRLREMVGSLKANEEAAVPSHDNYQLVVNGPEPTSVSSISMRNFQGWLSGEVSGDGSSSGLDLPAIALVGYYDTFGAAPDMATGADSNGSGVVAVLELARLFSKLYNGFKTHAAFNLLFVLTGAGYMNYAGTKDWLQTVDSRILDSLQFVLCLDSIGAMNKEKLYLHVSRPPRAAAVKQIYSAFKNTAAAMEIPFDMVHKKINVSNPDLAWENEQFSLKRVVSATLSHYRTPSTPFASASIFDGAFAIDPKLLKRNIKFVAESLAQHIYGLSLPVSVNSSAAATAAGAPGAAAGGDEVAGGAAKEEVAGQDTGSAGSTGKSSSISDVGGGRGRGQHSGAGGPW
jgi:hypothetical protein